MFMANAQKVTKPLSTLWNYHNRKRILLFAVFSWLRQQFTSIQRKSFATNYQLLKIFLFLSREWKKQEMIITLSEFSPGGGYLYFFSETFLWLWNGLPFVYFFLELTNFLLQSRQSIRHSKAICIFFLSTNFLVNFCTIWNCYMISITVSHIIIVNV